MYSDKVVIAHAFCNISFLFCSLFWYVPLFTDFSLLLSLEAVHYGCYLSPLSIGPMFSLYVKSEKTRIGILYPLKYAAKYNYKEILVKKHTGIGIHMRVCRNEDKNFVALHSFLCRI